MKLYITIVTILNVHLVFSALREPASLPAHFAETGDQSTVPTFANISEPIRENDKPFTKLEEKSHNGSSESITTVRPEFQRLEDPSTKTFLDETDQILLKNYTLHTAAENISRENSCDSINELIQPEIQIRQCCRQDEFRSQSTNGCKASADFSEQLINCLLGSSSSNISTFSKTLDECSSRTEKLDLHSPYRIVANSHEYCLELEIGSLADFALVLEICPFDNIIPKCCSLGSFYNDSENANCTPFTYPFDEAVNLLPDIFENYVLRFASLQCEAYPQNINLRDTYFEGSTLCMNGNGVCYLRDKYCIDNWTQRGTSTLIQSALVCPEIPEVSKCCPIGEGFKNENCVQISQPSAYLVGIFETFKYSHQKKPFYNQDKNCTPITIYNDLKTDISWVINSVGTAEITTNNVGVNTENFCVDDTKRDENTTPVLRVCREEILSADVRIAKCCPKEMIYQIDATKCINKMIDHLPKLSETEELMRHNISNLFLTRFPDYSNSGLILHKYLLGNSTSDYAELTKNGFLKIIYMSYNCKMGESAAINSSMFCLEYITEADQYKPFAFVWEPEPTNQQSPERAPIIITLVAISCISLIASLFIIICSNVQRGMIMVYKVSTLAGFIQLNYILSLLISNVVLIAITLEDQHITCVSLSGFLIFFTIAAFCWNTSICLDFLLIANYVRSYKKMRYWCHSLWGWVVPAAITATTLILNSKNDELSCSVVKPRLGEKKCFFSDSAAISYYFYIPISITVILNCIFLVSYILVKQSTRENLGRDYPPVLKQVHLQKVLSMQNVKSIVGRKLTITIPSHSGLRIHEKKALWVESIKLVIWSGATWVFEIAGILVPMFVRSEGKWYDYLWYIPVSANCLRGLGIFLIFSTSKETQSIFSRTYRIASSNFAARLSTLRAKTMNRKKSPYYRRDIIAERFIYISHIFSQQNNASISSVDKTECKLARPYNLAKCKNIYFKESGKSNNEDEINSISSLLAGASNSYSTLCELAGASNSASTLYESPRSELPAFSHSASHGDLSNRGIVPKLIVNSYFGEYNADDLDSLDNTSMELAFWDKAPSTTTLNNLEDNVIRNKSFLKNYNADIGVMDKSKFHRPLGLRIKSTGFEIYPECQTGEDTQNLRVNELNPHSNVYGKPNLIDPENNGSCVEMIKHISLDNPCTCPMQCENTYL